MEEREIITLVFELVLVSSVLIVLFILIVAAFRIKRNEHIEEKRLREMDYQQQLFQSQMEVQEATINALGRELHDNVGQLLTSAKFMVNIGKQNSKQIHEVLDMLDDTLDRAMVETRSLSKVLNADWLSQFSLLENLEVEIKRLKTSSKVSLTLTRPEKIDLEAEKQTILFRIVQEALQNALKHATPTNIDVEVSNLENNRLGITVADDGVGIQVAGQHDGQGMLNMKKRVDLLKGTIQWKNNAVKGCSVEIAVPIS